MKTVKLKVVQNIATLYSCRSNFVSKQEFHSYQSSTFCFFKGPQYVMCMLQQRKLFFFSTKGTNNYPGLIISLKNKLNRDPPTQRRTHVSVIHFCLQQTPSTVSPNSTNQNVLIQCWTRRYRFREKKKLFKCNIRKTKKKSYFVLLDILFRHTKI